MNVHIRLARKSDLKQYTDLLQKTYQATYPNKQLGLTKQCFSRDVFQSSHTQSYLSSNLMVSGRQKAWLAFSDGQLVGSITVEKKGQECELRGFYVSPSYQPRGIGKMLWQYAIDFSGQKNMILAIFAHNTRSIKMYKNWGFVIDKEKVIFESHWPEWPENVKVKYLYMLLKKPA